MYKTLYKKPYKIFQKRILTPAQKVQKTISYFKRRIRKFKKRSRWLKRKKLKRKKRNRKFYRKPRRISAYLIKSKVRSFVRFKKVKILKSKVFYKKLKFPLFPKLSLVYYNFTKCFKQFNTLTQSPKFKYFNYK